MIVVDLGCGTNKRRGAVGVDNVPVPGVDIVHDLLDFPYPFAGGTVDRVILSHVLEHFTIEQGHVLLAEIDRMLRPGGLLEISVPHAFCVAAWVDPTHRRYFTFESVRFLARDTAKAYYKETANVWDLAAIAAGVTLFNWKLYRLRQVDRLASRALARLLTRMLMWSNFPGTADLLVKILPLYFVNVRWLLRKPHAGS